MNIKAFIKDKDYQLQRVFLIIVVVCIFIGIWTVISENHRNEAFKSSTYTWGIIDKMNKSSRPGRTIDFHFYNKQNRKIAIINADPVENCFEDRVVGDTILVKYSLEDNQIAAIKYCYWNEKIKEQLADKQ